MMNAAANVANVDPNAINPEVEEYEDGEEAAVEWPDMNRDEWRQVVHNAWLNGYALLNIAMLCKAANEGYGDATNNIVLRDFGIRASATKTHILLCLGIGKFGNDRYTMNSISTKVFDNAELKPWLKNPANRYEFLTSRVVREIAIVLGGEGEDGLMAGLATLKAHIDDKNWAEEKRKRNEMERHELMMINRKKREAALDKYIHENHPFGLEVNSLNDFCAVHGMGANAFGYRFGDYEFRRDTGIHDWFNKVSKSTAMPDTKSPEMLSIIERMKEMDVTRAEKKRKADNLRTEAYNDRRSEREMGA